MDRPGPIRTHWPTRPPTSEATIDPTGRLTRLLAGWAASDGPLGRRLATALADLVTQGDLRDGDRLPSERVLGGALGVSRGTVTEAYDLLRADGVLESRVGRGSFVRAPGGGRGPAPLSEGRLVSFDGTVADPARDLSSGAPGGLDLVARHTARIAADPRLAALVGGDGYAPAGLPALREALAASYAERGVPTSAEEVLVTSGSQQALAMVAGALVSPGDVVLVEDPTYRGALDALRARGARLVPVPVDQHGPDLDVLERLVRRLRPRLLYTLPIAHNPTGYVVTPERAAGVRRVLADCEVVVVEDGSPADLLLDVDRPPTPLGHGLPPQRWLALGSASKLFWGGLRIGWVRGDATLLAPLARAKAVADLGSSPLTQLVAASCFSDAHLARRERRTQLERGAATATAVLAEHAPEWTWTRPAGGSGLWVRVPGLDAVAFGQHARRAGTLVSPGPVFSAVEGFTDHLRIPFWRDPDTLTAGLTHLVDLWRTHELGRTRSRPPAPPAAG